MVDLSTDELAIGSRNGTFNLRPSSLSERSR